MSNRHLYRNEGNMLIGLLIQGSYNQFTFRQNNVFYTNKIVNTSYDIKSLYICGASNIS